MKNRTWIYSLSIVSVFLVFLNGCSKDNSKDTVGQPTLSTTIVDNIAAAEARSGGSIITEGT